MTEEKAVALCKRVTFTVANTTFQGNKPIKGGGIPLRSKCNFSNCTFSNNISSSLAGAIMPFVQGYFKFVSNPQQSAELDGGVYTLKIPNSTQPQVSFEITTTPSTTAEVESESSMVSFETLMVRTLKIKQPQAEGNLRLRFEYHLGRFYIFL